MRTTEETGAVHVELGERLRAIRQLRRKTLKEVAGAAGISESFLSQLERGRTNATIATLQRLATALGIDVSDLFASRCAPAPGAPSGGAGASSPGGYLGRKALLTPKPFHSLEVVVARFEPGGSTGDEPYTHGDSEELLIVVEGACTCSSAPTSTSSPPATASTTRARRLTASANAGDETAEVMFVISPPSY